MTHRYFIYLSFDGTAYHGWQIQPNGITVQEKLQQCLHILVPQTGDVTGAGRTDAGVHARLMVAHFDTETAVDTAQLTYRLNRMLPGDIAVRRIEPVSSEMHARFSAKARTYHYYIHREHDPFLGHYSVETHYHLDFDRMNEAAATLLQVTDFGAFCKAGADVKTTLCHVTEAEWRHLDGDGDRWCFVITANRFLRNMVRAIVGTLFEVGRGRMTVDGFRHVVATGTRRDAGESMPARGLFLWDIRYDNIQ